MKAKAKQLESLCLEFASEAELVAVRASGSAELRREVGAILLARARELALRSAAELSACVQRLGGAL